MTDPVVSEVAVDPRLAATGKEEFDTGSSLFSKKPSREVSEEPEEANSKVEPGLLTYPFVALFDLAAAVRQFDGWKLDPNPPAPGMPSEVEYFNMLSRYLLKRFSKVKDLDLIICAAGIMSMMVRKGTADVEYHKAHPIVGKGPGERQTGPPPGASNPESPVGRENPPT